MRSFIRQKKPKPGTTIVQIVHKHGRKVDGLEHIGTAHSDEERETLLAQAYALIHDDEKQLSLALPDPPTNNKPAIKGESFVEKTYSELLWNTLAGVYDHLGFNNIKDDVFKQLVLARIIEPTSKLDTIRVLGDLGLQAPAYSTIHRCLRRTVYKVIANKETVCKGYRNLLCESCFDQAKPEALTLVLYDVTTLYFEIQKEDEYRKPGLSKERRLEPQIIIGLLVDRTGFPLEIQSFEGNKAETNTILPVLKGFRERHHLKNITVTADAAMLSSGNISALEALEYNYIIGSRNSKMPYEVEGFQNELGMPMEDGQVLELEKTVTIDGHRSKRRIIYQYRASRAKLDLSNIDKALAKTLRVVKKEIRMNKNRFLLVDGAELGVNEALLARARQWAGIKGYVTSLRAVPAPEIIAAYHQLFQVEKSFRMSKSDLKARPIFHHKRDSIEAHLTIVFAALAIARRIEAATGMSIKKFVQTLAPLKTVVISEHGELNTYKPRVPENVKTIIDCLEKAKLVVT